MRQSGMKTLLPVLVAFGFRLVVAGFEVRVSREPVLAIHGHDAVLRCSFTPSGTSTQGIVITWQREDNQEVVYSYYYNEHQLGQQSPRYAGRASLSPEEIIKGNASLILKGVRPEDSGEYVCFVSTRSADAKGTISLQFAAYYREPILTIQLGKNATLFRFESQGFPQAAISWFDEQHENISSQTDTFFQQNADGLYSMSSALEIADTRANSSKYTFTISNDVLGQSLSRTIVLTSESKRETESPAIRNHWIPAVILMFIELIVILILVMFIK